MLLGAGTALQRWESNCLGQVLHRRGCKSQGQHCTALHCTALHCTAAAGGGRSSCRGAACSRRCAVAAGSRGAAAGRLLVAGAARRAEGS